jgi:hypothetical protein
LESGNEGLRCRFAWTARVEEVAASFDAHCKGVTCRGDPELIGDATTVTVVLPTGEELVCDPVCEPVNSLDQVKKKSKEYSSQIWKPFSYFLKSLRP